MNFFSTMDFLINSVSIALNDRVAFEGFDTFDEFEDAAQFLLQYTDASGFWCKDDLDFLKMYYNVEEAQEAADSILEEAEGYHVFEGFLKNMKRLAEALSALTREMWNSEKLQECY